VTQVALVPDQLRRVAGTLNDAASEGRVVADRVLNAPMPEMPAGVAGVVATGLDNVARTLSGQTPALQAANEELRVRAFWGDIADAQSACRNLTDAQIAELFAFMSSGALLRYGVTADQAEFAGRMLAGRFRENFDDPASLRELAALLRPNAANAHFAAGFIDAFGTENFVEIPRVLQAMEHPWSIAYGTHLTSSGALRLDIAVPLADDSDYDGEENVLELLAPFTQALAVATYGGTLSRDRQREIAEDDDQWAVASLLSHEGRYGKDFLLEVFERGVVQRIEYEHAAGEGFWDEAQTDDFDNPLGWTSEDGGLPRDTKVIILNALARNEDAAAAALTAPIQPLELSRLIDSEHMTVTDPLQLLLEFGTYGDDGSALGEASASAVFGLHDDGRGADANQMTERLIHEVVEGERRDIDAVRNGVARVVASPDIMEDLHRVAGRSESSSAFDPDQDGLAGSSDEDGIRLSGLQLADLLGELSDEELARERLLAGVTAYQTNEILEATGPNGPPNQYWATEIGNFDGILVEANNEDRLDDFGDRKERHEQIFGAVNHVAGLIPGGKVVSLPLDVGLGAISDATEPSQGPVLDENYVASQEMRGRLEAAIVAGYFEHGAFGSSSDVEAQIRSIDDSPGYEAKSFLDSNGQIIPYDQMDADQRATFEDWTSSDRVQNVVQRALESAGNGVDARVRE
jgi:hypothetical protein